LKPGKTAFRTGRPSPIISARGTSKELLEMAIEEYVVSLNLIINDIIVGYEEEETIEFLWGYVKKESKTLLQLRVAREVKSLRLTSTGASEVQGSRRSGSFREQCKRRE
jgi:hypothetical protein